jgi:hypothetical protein
MWILHCPLVGGQAGGHVVDEGFDVTEEVAVVVGGVVVVAATDQLVLSPVDAPAVAHVDLPDVLLGDQPVQPLLVDDGDVGLHAKLRG